MGSSLSCSNDGIGNRDPTGDRISGERPSSFTSFDYSKDIPNAVRKQIIWNFKSIARAQEQAMAPGRRERSRRAGKAASREMATSAYSGCRKGASPNPRDVDRR
jgi:hypothetical protein